MALTWAGRRQALYSGVGAIIICILLIVLYQTLFTSAATCFDGKQNGNETGIDCGGNSCSLICANVARPPVVDWARSFQTTQSTYSAVAYVQNNNANAGAKNVPYFFQLFDDKNILIAEREGVAEIPPLQVVPIIESNIQVGNRKVARTLFAFTEDPPAVWNKVAPNTYPKLTIGQTSREDDFSKLSAVVSNNNVFEVKNVTVVAILYDADGVAIETSKSVLPRIAGRSSEPVVFTWPFGVPNTSRFEILVLPAF